MSDTSYVGSEVMPAEQYLGPRQYRITCYCHRCNSEFSYTAKSVPKKDRDCPKKSCRTAALREQWEAEQANMAKIILEQRAPGHIGENITVKAIDKTAEIVMQDHGMTDLKDNIRSGESMAPRLPGKMQGMADNFFTNNALKDQGIGARQAEMLKRRAISGAFRNMAVSPTVTGGTTGESPMRLVRKESLK